MRQLFLFSSSTRASFCRIFNKPVLMLAISFSRLSFFYFIIFLFICFLPFSFEARRNIFFILKDSLYEDLVSSSQGKLLPMLPHSLIHAEHGTTT
jgi:hypothetical protein